MTARTTDASRVIVRAQISGKMKSHPLATLQRVSDGGSCHVGVWGGILFFSSTEYGQGKGGERRDTPRKHTHTHRNIHANVAPTL